jgi:hypothetical protein
MKLSHISRALLAAWLTMASASLAPLSAVPVKRAEAIAVGDLWHAMEVNSKHSKLSSEQKAAHLASIPSRQVWEIDERYEVSAKGSADGTARAYILTYSPGGWVVVAGDDRLHPVLAYALDSAVTWESPQRNFLRYFVTNTLTEAETCWQLSGTNSAKLPPHEMWLAVRTVLQDNAPLTTAAFEELPRLLQEKFSPGSSPKASGVFVLMDTALWNQAPFYNDECNVHNGNNVVPTGCVATGAAIKMRYHSWPPLGAGSHAYTDSSGSIQYSHSVTFSNWSYAWASMPTTDLTNTNAEVARAMYHCGVMVDMDYETGSSGAQTPDIARANQYFHYRGAVGNYSFDKNGIIESVRALLPVNVGGGGHSVVVDGYRDTPSEAFHINAGWGGQCNAWYTVGLMPHGGGCVTASIEKCVPYMAPDIYRYVDGVHRGSPDGTLQNAYETLGAALGNVPAGGEIWLKAGTYSAPTVMAQPVTLKAYHQEAVTLAH